MGGNFDVSMDRRPDGVDVRLAGELDAAAVFRLEPLLDDLPAEPETREVVFDLRPLTFIDSAGLSVLVAANERFESRGVDTSFVRPERNVMRVFELTGLDEAFRFRGPER